MFLRVVALNIKNVLSTGRDPGYAALKGMFPLSSHFELESLGKRTEMVCSQVFGGLPSLCSGQDPSRNGSPMTVSPGLSGLSFLQISQQILRGSSPASFSSHPMYGTKSDHPSLAPPPPEKTRCEVL